ncbi:MAG: aminotransferase class IV [Microthrixaceae bacterium]
MVVWLDGARREPAEAALHWSDHGITVGDGVFETLKLTDDGPFALTRHLDRLERSAAGLGLTPPPRPTLLDAVEEVVAARPGPGRLRITVTGGPGPMGSARGDAGPTLLLTAGPMAVDRSPTTVLVVPWTRNERGAVAGLKTTSYAENVVALAAATSVGASEALLANTVGELCEGTGSNVFVVFDDRVVTPPLSSGCLAGVTRALLLEALAATGRPAAEEPVPMAELDAADEVFLVSSTRDVQPVARLLHHADPARARTLDAPGPVTRRCAEVWDAAYGPGGPLDP